MQASIGCVCSSIRSLVCKSIIKLPSLTQNTSSIRKMTTGPTYSASYLTDKLKANLEADHVEIEDLSNCGCGMKFDAVLVSKKFEGKPLLQRQRLVNQVLAEEMKHIHAFTMKTMTQAEWDDYWKKQGRESQ